MRVTEREGDVFDNLGRLRLPDGMVVKAKVEPRKVRERRKQFVQVPWQWAERLKHANHVWYIALYLLHQDWKGKGAPVKLPNGLLEFDGISRYAKYRALDQLEQRGLITVERRPRKSPVVRVIRDLPKPPA
jgi:hypothetical protein